MGKIKTTKRAMSKAKTHERNLKKRIYTLNKRLRIKIIPIKREIREEETKLAAIGHWIKTHEVRK